MVFAVNVQRPVVFVIAIFALALHAEDICNCTRNPSMGKSSGNNPTSPGGSLDGLLTTAEAAKYLGLSASYLNKTRVTGTGPEFVKLSRAVRYRPSALDIWVNDRRYTSTSAVPQKVDDDDNRGPDGNGSCPVHPAR